MTTFNIETLPEIDQQQIKRGKCPWCLDTLIPGGIIDKDAGDSCPECGDEFVGKLTIKD